MKLFFKYVSYKKRTFSVFLTFVLIFFISFYLYRLPFEAVIYPLLLCCLVGFVFVLCDFFRVKKKLAFIFELEKTAASLIEVLPSPESLFEEEYGNVVRHLCSEMKNFSEKSEEQYRSTVEYYTLWAHQIKTPIASMRLNLQNEDSAFSRRLQNDLNRIDSYVDMVMTYLRLGSDTTDYLIREYSLDPIIKSSLKKFSGEFIIKKLSLSYSPSGLCAVTDEKWLSFVIEQILSNAVKYTPESGNITIYAEDNSLIIADSGIGISPEDLPRVFDTGYTGFNGRLDKKASGIGLGLCRRICDRLGHSISAESSPGKGTKIRITFPKNDRIFS